MFGSRLEEQNEGTVAGKQIAPYARGRAGWARAWRAGRDTLLAAFLLGIWAVARKGDIVLACKCQGPFGNYKNGFLGFKLSFGFGALWVQP